MNAYGYNNLEIKVGDALTHGKFHIVKECPNYGMILGRSWVHNNKEKLGVCPLPVSVP